MKTAEAAKGRWSEILNITGCRLITGKPLQGECPVCKARGSIALMTVTVRVHGSVHAVAVTDEAADPDPVKSFSAICAEVDQLIGNNYQRINVPSNSSAARQRQRVISKFSKLLDLRGTSAAGYLLQRG